MSPIPKPINIIDISEARTGRIKKVNDNFSNFFVLPKNTILIFCWIIIVIFSIMKGSTSQDSIIGIKQCSPVYWVLNVIQTLLIVIVGVMSGMYLFRIFKQTDDKDYVKGDIRWNKKNSMLLPPILLIGGLMASTFGLGGGIIKTPVMLELEMLPDVIVATSGYSLIFTASSSLVQYFIFGVLPLDYAVVFMGVGFISALTGHLIIGYLVNRKGKPKILILILGILTFLIAFIALGYGIYQFVIDLQDDVSMGFEPLCN